MQCITELRHLERYGLVPLTGEACGLMYRVLFNVTVRGHRILETCFNARFVLEEPFSAGSVPDPHIGSIMLAPEMLPAVGTFALLDSGCTEVWRKGDSLYGVEPTDDAEQLETFKKAHGPLRRLAYRGTSGDRNVR